MRRYSKLYQYIVSKDNLDKNGVYMIYHIDKPNIFYIGSTFRISKKICKKGFYGRWIEHFSKLRKNQHHNKYLQNVVNKYGSENLRFEIIEICEKIESVRERERYYINFYDSYRNGYNSTYNTECSIMSEQTKKLNSIRMTNNNPMKNKEVVLKQLKTKKENYCNYILQYSLDGVLLREWKSTIEISENIRIDASNISRCLNNETKKSAGYIWIYKDEFSETLLSNKINQLKSSYRKRTIEEINKMSQKLMKKVSCYTLEGKHLKSFNSIKEATSYYNISNGNISKCCNNIYRSCNNMIWRFDESSCGMSKCG